MTLEQYYALRDSVDAILDGDTRNHVENPHNGNLISLYWGQEGVYVSVTPRDRLGERHSYPNIEEAMNAFVTYATHKPSTGGSLKWTTQNID